MGILALAYRVVISFYPHLYFCPPTIWGKQRIDRGREANEIDIPKVPKIWNVARHVSTQADAGSDGEEGEETTATNMQTKQHLVEQAAIWVCVVVEQEHSCYTCHAVES